MYSRNDYRYYLERRLAASDDFLAHYGVKGMRKGKHLPQVLERLRKAKEEFDNAGSIPEYIDSRASKKQRRKNVVNLITRGDYGPTGRENFGKYKKNKFKTKKQRARNIAKIVAGKTLE